MKITYFGHSAFMIKENDFTFLIDPYITGNPHTDIPIQELKPDYILLTHGHGDHIGDALKIAKNSNAVIIAPAELANYCERKGAKIHPMHIGGGFNFDFGRVKLTQALHGSAVTEGDQVIYTGNPCGFLLIINGQTLYHAGDTGLFSDMKLIGELNKIDIALLPIGDNFTMGVDDAVYATSLIKPVLAIPMHYNTFGYIIQDPEEFVKKIENKGHKCLVLEMNKEYEL